MEQNNIETYLGTFDENSFVKFPLHIALNCLELHKDRVEDLTEVLNDKEYLDKYCEDNNITYQDAAVDLEIAILDLKEAEQFLVLHSLEKMN
jgi:hypothetical protein